MALTIVSDANEVRRLVLQWQREDHRVGFVPTMGALHQGHLSLVQASMASCSKTVVSIFVNPTQFGPGEDFEKYPRDLHSDSELLENAGADLVYAPVADSIYRPRHSTFIEPPKVAQGLEGEKRPGHFRGVTTIVLKLLQIVPADIAFFGEKDYQQVRVIQDMCRDLDLPVTVQACPTLRESDGLAMSSRNAYLSEADRQRALSLSQSLRRGSQMVQDGCRSPSEIQAELIAILEAAPVDAIDYVALVDPVSLAAVREVVPRTRALIAAYVGKTRLIDNAALG